MNVCSDCYCFCFCRFDGDGYLKFFTLRVDCCSVIYVLNFLILLWSWRKHVKCLMYLNFCGFVAWFMAFASKMERLHMSGVMWGLRVLNKKSSLAGPNSWRLNIEQGKKKIFLHLKFSVMLKAFVIQNSTSKFSNFGFLRVIAREMIF